MTTLCLGQPTRVIRSYFVRASVGEAVYSLIESGFNEDSRVWKNNACVRIEILSQYDACVTNNV
jgi:hypothetical protein